MDANAFETLITSTYDADRRSLTLYAARRSSADDADDVVAEAYLRAWRYRATFTDDGRGVAPWLRTIARNVIVDRARRRRVEQAVLTEARHVAAPETLHDEVERREALEELRAMAELLTPQQRSVVMAELAGDASVADLAGRMGLVEGTFRTRRHRAIRQLRLRVGTMRRAS